MEDFVRFPQCKHKLRALSNIIWMLAAAAGVDYPQSPNSCGVVTEMWHGQVEGLGHRYFRVHHQPSSLPRNRNHDAESAIQNTSLVNLHHEHNKSFILQVQKLQQTQIKSINNSLQTLRKKNK